MGPVAKQRGGDLVAAFIPKRLVDALSRVPPEMGGAVFTP